MGDRTGVLYKHIQALLGRVAPMILDRLTISKLVALAVRTVNGEDCLQIRNGPIVCLQLLQVVICVDFMGMGREGGVGWGGGRGLMGREGGRDGKKEGWGWMGREGWEKRRVGRDGDGEGWGGMGKVVSGEGGRDGKRDVWGGI